MRTRCTRYKLLTPLVHARAREEGLCCDADFGGQTVCLAWEVAELEALNSRLMGAIDRLKSVNETLNSVIQDVY